MDRGRVVLAALAALVVLAALAGLVGWRNARSDPVVRQAVIALPDWPVAQGPVRVALLSDIHIGDGASAAARLTRVVQRVNNLHPDLVLIAGDFFPGEQPIGPAAATGRLAALRRLQARLGVVAVPGNHDHWTGLQAVAQALAAANVTLLANQAQRRGPLVLAAVDDTYSGHARVAETVAAARRLLGARLVLTHSPDIAPQLPPDFRLLLAGHTHCGQVVLPLIGSLASAKYYQARYRCGLIREGRRAIIVTGGIGGSLPFRIGAAPDLWLLTLGP